MGRPPIQLPRITFRFPDDLRALLAEAAEVNGRSVNQEVVDRLMRSFDPPAKPPPLADQQWWQKIIREEVEKAVEGLKSAGELP